MSKNLKSFLLGLLVAICTFIVSWSSSSCSAGLVIGHNNRQLQESSSSIKTDSTTFIPTIQIR